MKHTVSLAFLACAFAVGSAWPQGVQAPRGDGWLKSPSLSIMTGFICQPKSPYSVQQWLEGLGSRFDAERWVKDFKDAGATYLIFYDKWIDGLVFHDTKTTGYKTTRDFVREIAAACQRNGLRLVFYFNAVSDGNPEFDEWALLDREGKPIVFAPNWPTRFQTLHSPFRQRSVAQVRELLGNYGRVDALWLDVFHERLNTSSAWTAKAYEKMFSEPFDKASPQKLGEFQVRTLAGYLDEVQAIAREQGQRTCLWTANGSGARLLQSDVWTQWVGARLDYGSLEAHSFARNDEAAPMAWALPKPLEIGFLLNTTWFTPLEDKPPAARPTEPQAIAGTAIAVCQGANVYLALTPGHAGEFGEDLQRAKAIGAWYRKTQPWLENAQPYADVGIMLGVTVSASALTDELRREGVFTRWLRAPMPCRAILLPAQTRLDEAQAGQLRQYGQDGGLVIAFGQSSLLDDLLGARFKGNLAFPVKLRGASVKVDSEYSPEYPARHLLDGQPTFWASSGSAMPHWAEITLPEPVEVQTVELVSREGPYLVTDVDIELPAGRDWRVAKSIRNAKSRTIIAKLTPPAKTDRVRVKILRELFQGQERHYADVESIRVLDRAGRDWVSALPEPVRVIGATPDFIRWFGDSLAFAPWAAAVEPTTAEVLCRFDHHGNPPAILRNKVGRGQALLVTASDPMLRDNAAFWTGIRKLAVGEPTLSVKSEHARRFRFILTRVGDSHVLHVIDAEVPAAGYQPQQVEVSLAAQPLGSPKQAALVGSDNPLAMTQDAGRISFVVQPAPVASVVLR